MQKAWNDYYPNEEKPVAEDNFFSGLTFNSGDKRISSSMGNAYVYNCYFHDITTDYGAAIFSAQTSNLLIEKCSIKNCTAKKDTAGIRVTKGNCIIAFICGYNTKAEEYDAFSAVHTDSNREINFVFDSSISHCEANNAYTMAHTFGNIYIKSVNLSRNKAKYYSALCCGPSKINDETNYGTDIISCSISNNTATHQYCIYLTYNNSTNKHQIKNCNIIENNSSNTIYSNGKTNIYFSSIINNNEPCFGISETESKITLSMCSTDKTELSTVSINGQQITDSSLLSLPYIHTGFCDISFHYCHCTENSILPNLCIHKIIIPSPFIFLLLSK